MEPNPLNVKVNSFQALSEEFQVIASIGDSFEEEQADEAMGISFVKVDPCNPADAWIVLAARIAEFGGFTG